MTGDRVRGVWTHTNACTTILLGASQLCVASGHRTFIETRDGDVQRGKDTGRRHSIAILHFSIFGSVSVRGDNISRFK